MQASGRCFTDLNVKNQYAEFISKYLELFSFFTLEGLEKYKPPSHLGGMKAPL